MTEPQPPHHGQPAGSAPAPDASPGAQPPAQAPAGSPPVPRTGAYPAQGGPPAAPGGTHAPGTPGTTGAHGPAGVPGQPGAGIGAQPSEGRQPAPGRPGNDGAETEPGGLRTPEARLDVDPLRAALLKVRGEVGKAVVGQDTAVTGVIIALLTRGHILLEGVPGVAKTLLIRALAAALDLDSKRVQFTPDLMPGDITGSLVYDNSTSRFSFREGPVFTNLLLADEINRTPPKSQSALLEAMEERQVSSDGRALKLPEPFIVAATQNPVEYEGTYPLPEAQLDRFLLKIVLELPDAASEFEILRRHAEGFNPSDLSASGITAVADRELLAQAVAAVKRVHVAPEVLQYIVGLVHATRHAPSFSLGVSPRGATALLSTSRAWAWLQGREYVTPDDVKALVLPTLRHRVQLRPEAQMEGIGVDDVLQAILSTTEAPR